MSQNDNDHDVRDGSMSQTTRRGLLGALGVAGLASLGSGSASAQLGGGPEADAMSEYRVPTYRVPESDLDSPGVVGRRVEITSGGSSYSAGDQLVDLGDRWELVSPNYGSVSAESLGGGAEHIVTSGSELESVLDNDLSPGDTVWIAQGDTPHETTQWLDIDTDGITIAAESCWAKDGFPILKVAGGANVGGFRIGYNRSASNPVRDVTINGVGHNGNAVDLNDDLEPTNISLDDIGNLESGSNTNQDQSIDHLDSVKIAYAENTRIENNYLTNQSPYHQHGNGGSAVSCQQPSRRTWILGNWFNYVGDQGVQCGAEDIVVNGNTFTNGYDRNVSPTAGDDSFSASAGNYVAVVNNFGRGNEYGSWVGIGVGGDPSHHWLVANNIARGGHKQFVRIQEGRHITVVGNNGYQESTNVQTPGTNIASGSRYVTVVGNVFRGYTQGGIAVGGERFTVQNNIVRGVENIGISIGGSFGSVGGNIVDGATANGIQVTGSDVSLTQNGVRNCGNNGMSLTGSDLFVGFNLLEDNSPDGDEISHNAPNSVFIGNRIVSRGGGTSFNSFGGPANVRYLGNEAPDDGNTWSLSGEMAQFALNNPEPTGVAAPVVINDAATESANAEEPQKAWPEGTTVDFIDSGDNSGSGVYQRIDGSWVQLA